MADDVQPMWRPADDEPLSLTPPPGMDAPNEFKTIMERIIATDMAREQPPRCAGGNPCPVHVPLLHEQPAGIRPAPEYPEGTPEYDAYAAELRAELDKWRRGDPPYSYDSDVTLVADAIATAGGMFTNLPENTRRRAARVILAALAGAERLRVDDADVASVLQARWRELQAEAATMGARQNGKAVMVARAVEVHRLANALGIGLD